MYNIYFIYINCTSIKTVFKEYSLNIEKDINRIENSEVDPYWEVGSVRHGIFY